MSAYAYVHFIYVPSLYGLRCGKLLPVRISKTSLDTSGGKVEAISTNWESQKGLHLGPYIGLL